MTKQYDVVVVGAGHSGLVAALEFAAAGWSVLVLEREPHAGGMAITTEPLMAGFRHNPHANTLIFADVMPERFSPHALGVRLTRPEAQLGVAFADGRPPVILHRPDLLQRTVASLGVYSRADSATYRDLKTKADKVMGEWIRRGLYGAPDAVRFETQLAEIERVFADQLDLRGLGQRSARAFIDSVFEAPEVRLLLYHLATETGVGLDDPGGDASFLSYSLWIAGRWRTVAGGMGAYTAALYAAAGAAGVRVACSSRVQRILTERGRAIGVSLAGGEMVLARRGVLAAIPLLDAADMIEVDLLAAEERNELEVFRAGRPGTIASSCYCLTRAPRYKSARHDPEIDACLKTIIGHDRPDEAIVLAADIRAGLLPKPAGVVRVHSHWDGTLAPAGCHVAGVDSSFPAREHLDADTWAAIEAAFPEALAKVWTAHCEGDVLDVAAMKCDARATFERRMLLRMGPGQYRTSVDGLYLGGPGMYPGGGVHGACGHNAAQVMLGDCNGRSG